MRRALVPALCLLAGCSLIRSLASSSFQKPGLTFKEARLPKIDFNGAELDLVFLVNNPNSMGLDLTKADYALEVEGHQLLAGKPQNGLVIPGGATTEVTFPASFTWNDIAPALEALFGQDQVKYKATGALGINSPIGPITLPLEHEGSFASPKMPKFDVGSPQVTSVSLTGARLSVPLKISNLNAFPLPLGGILGSVEIAGSKVGRISLPEAPAVPGGKDSTIRIPLDVSFLSSGAAVANAIRTGVAEVKIDAILNAAGATLPVKVSKTVELNRSSGAAGP
jgi:LEA14-like dessication related protein